MSTDGPGTKRQLAALLTPFVVIVLVPAMLIVEDGPPNPGWGLDMPLVLVPLLAGALLLGGGLMLMVITIGLLQRAGEGTIMPWDPTRRLVISGIYRYVRNPMISGICAVVLGEALIFGLPSLLAWAVAVAALNAVYIPLVEERRLSARFGDPYAEYQQHVPRWLPRRTPWTPPTDG